MSRLVDVVAVRHAFINDIKLSAIQAMNWELTQVALRSMWSDVRDDIEVTKEAAEALRRQNEAPEKIHQVLQWQKETAFVNKQNAASAKSRLDLTIWQNTAMKTISDRHSEKLASVKADIERDNTNLTSAQAQFVEQIAVFVNNEGLMPLLRQIIHDGDVEAARREADVRYKHLCESINEIKTSLEADLPQLYQESFEKATAENAKVVREYAEGALDEFFRARDASSKAAAERTRISQKTLWDRVANGVVQAKTDIESESAKSLALEQERDELQLEVNSLRENASAKD